MVSATKLTYCSFVFAVLAAGSFALPQISRLYAGEHVDNKVSGDVTIVENAGWIFEHLAAIISNTFKDGLFNVVHTWFVDLAARVEFLVMADGSHFIFPHCGKADEEREHRIIAIAVSKLLRNLHTMERTNELIRNVTKTILQTDSPHYYAATDKSSWSMEKKMSAFMGAYFKTMDRLFEEDKHLAMEYGKQKDEATKYVAKHDVEMKPALAKVWEANGLLLVGKEDIMTFLRDKETYRQAVFNKIFMKRAVKNAGMIFDKKYLEHFTLARALMKKAHQSHDFESKVNQVYQKALFKVGGAMYLRAAKDDVMDALFAEIRKGLEADSALDKEIRDSMKQIEQSTEYDFDMVHVDLSFI